VIKLLVPKEGLIIRDPFTMSILNPVGETKEMNNFWRRRLLDGSVSEKEETSPSLVQPAQKSSKYSNPKSKNRYSRPESVPDESVNETPTVESETVNEEISEV